MRRIAAILLVLAVAGGASVALAGDGGPYRVAAVFDSARGMVPGQQVKVAGAVVGRVERVDLAPGPKARMTLEVDEDFAPFRADATCRILPEGLISENYVECDPGDVSRPPLADRGDGLPEIAVEATAVPVALQDVINMFDLPTDQRLRVLFHELGIATAGRGDDLNALLRRTNPALGQAQRLLAIVARQRRDVGAAITQTDRVLDALAHDERGVRSFVTQGARLARISAGRRGQLREGVRRLPALMTSVRTGLRAVDGSVAAATPLLGRVRAAAPELTDLTRTLPAFAAAGTPALRELGPAARAGRTASAAALGVTQQLRTAARELRPTATDLRALLADTREQGGIEGLLRIAYGISSSTSAYDATSHIIGLAITTYPQCLEDPATPGCSAKYDSPKQGTVPVNAPDCEPESVAPWGLKSGCRVNASPLGVPIPPPPARSRGERPRRPLDLERAKPAPPRRKPVPGAVEIPKLPRLGGLLDDAPIDIGDVTDLLDFLLAP